MFINCLIIGGMILTVLIGGAFVKFTEEKENRKTKWQDWA